MTRDEYMSAVRRVLEEHTAQAEENLEITLTRIPAKATRLILEIFMDQDGEGELSVRANLDGPDLYVLNKAIAANADLFSGTPFDDDSRPTLPLMEPGGESFSVHDALSDVAARWIELVWNRVRPRVFSLPVSIETHDGYGTITPLNVN